MLNRSSVSLCVLSIAVCGCASEEPTRNTLTPAVNPVQEASVKSEDSTIAGGYSASAVDGPEVTAAAEFAVTEEAKKGAKLSLKSIKSAETQVVAGTNYKLNLVVDDGGTEKTVEVVVYRDLQQNMSLTSWTAQ